MPQSNWACVPQLLVLCSRAHQLQLLRPKRPRARAPQQERLLQCEACALQLESSLHSPQLEERPRSNEDPAQPQINKVNFFLKKALKEFPSGLVVKGSFPGGTSGKEPTCQCRRLKRHRFDPWVGKIPWRMAWKPTPVFLPGESHGQRSLMGYSLQGHKESDRTEVT